MEQDDSSNLTTNDNMRNGGVVVDESLSTTVTTTDTDTDTAEDTNPQNSSSTTTTSSSSSGSSPQKNAVLFNACSFSQEELKQLIVYHNKNNKNNNNNNKNNKNNNSNNKHKTEEFGFCLERHRKKAFIELTDDFLSKNTGTTTTNLFTKEEPMSWMEHSCALLVLTFGVPVGVFTIPVALYIIGKFVIGNAVKETFQWFFLLIVVPSIIVPQPFVPSTLQSWIVVCLLKYFSYRNIVEDYDALVGTLPSKERPRMYVGPPHGVFPYGNILSMFIHPCLMGRTRPPDNDDDHHHHSHGKGRLCCFRGIASSAALRTPIFKQLLRCIGITDASRHIARQVLETPHEYAIGISTGGVAEVFETSTKHECILLKERIGMIKLAIRTGSDLIPCYVFGNTLILSCYAGDGIPGCKSIIQKVSRKLGFALIWIYGRFGCPIPYRVPILSVMGKPIPTHHIKTEHPTDQQVQQLQQQFLSETERIFQQYKQYYGWHDKKLIIK